MNKNFPVFDLHCDLLTYMAHVPGADPAGTGDLGCSLPYLQSGNVKLQVQAIYSDVKKGSVDNALTQAKIYRNLINDYGDYFVNITDKESLNMALASQKIGFIAAIENAAGLCEEDAPLDDCFSNLEKIYEITGKILYIGITHHTENRFGGGNYSSAGLKEDGKVLLDYLHGRKIIVDLAHTSDALAYGILDYTAAKGLDIPIIASHSNFRTVYNHVRNLPDDIAREVIKRGGLIGINFLRAYLHETDPDFLIKHFLYGLEIGGEDSVCIGADFFYTKNFADKSRHPFYFPEHEDAGTYPAILKQLSQEVSSELVEKISNKNVCNYFQKIW
jgi:membrane dipeptidase